jgi:hypothetical protein
MRQQKWVTTLLSSCGEVLRETRRGGRHGQDAGFGEECSMAVSIPPREKNSFSPGRAERRGARNYWNRDVQPFLVFRHSCAGKGQERFGMNSKGLTIGKDMGRNMQVTCPDPGTTRHEIKAAATASAVAVGNPILSAHPATHKKQTQRDSH